MNIIEDQIMETVDHETLSAERDYRLKGMLGSQVPTWNLPSRVMQRSSAPWAILTVKIEGRFGLVSKVEKSWIGLRRVRNHNRQ